MYSSNSNDSIRNGRSLLEFVNFDDQCWQSSGANHFFFLASFSRPIEGYPTIAKRPNPKRRFEQSNVEFKIMAVEPSRQSFRKHQKRVRSLLILDWWNKGSWGDISCRGFCQHPLLLQRNFGKHFDSRTWKSCQRTLSVEHYHWMVPPKTDKIGKVLSNNNVCVQHME